MAFLDLGRTTEVGSDLAPRRPRSFWVAIVLAGTLVAVLLGVLRVSLGSRAEPSPVPPTVAVVREFLAAANAHDAERMRDVLAPDVVWVAAAGDRVGTGPYRGEDYIALQTSLPAFHAETLGDPVARADQVVVPTRISTQAAGGGGEGFAVFTLATVAGTTMITEILWVPSPRYR